MWVSWDIQFLTEYLPPCGFFMDCSFLMDITTCYSRCFSIHDIPRDNLLYHGLLQRNMCSNPLPSSCSLTFVSAVMFLSHFSHSSLTELHRFLKPVPTEVPGIAYWLSSGQQQVAFINNCSWLCLIWMQSMVSFHIAQT